MSVNIRKATFYDTKDLILPVADLIASGFKDKFAHKLFSKNDIQQIALVISQIICSQKKEHLLIAEKENNICGCLYFVDRKSERLIPKNSFKSYFSFFKRIKLFLLLAFFTHAPKKEETHIDFLSVSPSYSGMGVAQDLLFRCKELNQSNNITLYVASSNIPAFNLYKKTHFKTTKTISSRFGNWLTGIKTWHYMEWSQ